MQGRQKVRFWPTETNNSKIVSSMHGFNERALAGLIDFYLCKYVSSPRRY